MDLCIALYVLKWVSQFNIYISSLFLPHPLMWPALAIVLPGPPPMYRRGGGPRGMMGGHMRGGHMGRGHRGGGGGGGGIRNHRDSRK